MAIVSNAAVNIHVQVFVQDPVFDFFQVDAQEWNCWDAFLKKYLFILAVLDLSCGIWDHQSLLCPVVSLRHAKNANFAA